MAKVSVLMPHPGLKELAVALIAQYPRISPVTIEYVQTDQIRDRARALEAGGCDMIVARGLQARIARDSVRIPIIEMRASTQELALHVVEVRNALMERGYEKPRIGLIGFFNMFHATDHMNEMLDVDLRTYIATDIEQYNGLIDQAHAEGCVGVIGGDLVGRRARALGMSYRFLSMGEESVREAFESASLLGYSIDLNKRMGAEMNAMLDNLAEAVIEVNADGIIQRANRACFTLLGQDSTNTLGRSAVEVIPGLPANRFKKALDAGAEIDGAVIKHRDSTVLMSMTPVCIDGRIEGAICTFHEGERISQMDSRLRQELARKGQVALHTFAALESSDPAFQRLIEQARRLSRSPACVLLQGEGGTGKGILAQCIHNESAERAGAFVEVDCRAWHPDDLDGLLFGNFSARPSTRCLVEQAVDGSLYVRHIEALSPELQYKLLLLTRGQFLHNGRAELEAIRLRLIASTEVDLLPRVHDGRFRSDLYYALSAMRLRLPPLRERRDDIPLWLNRMLVASQKQSRRFVTLDPEALAWAKKQDWPGNLDQLQALCRRVVVLSARRTVGRETLEAALAAMASEPDDTRPTVVYRDQKAAELMELLESFHGNRKKTADALGISTTTLWRRMRQLGIGKDLTWEE